MPLRNAAKAPGDKRSLADRAYAAIEEKILSRELPPSAMVSENQLAEELKMGRTPIREALQRLKYIGFVEVHPARGVLVSGVDVTRQLELLEVRRPLEALVVRSAALRATPSERSELQQLAEELLAAATSKDRARYFRANRLIHEMVVQAAHNNVLSATMATIHAQSRRFWYTYIEQTNSFLEGARLHGAVIGAVVKADHDLAEKRAGELMAFLERLTRDVLEKRIVG
jgi:DNA-binding GntR family transcriptional regulator